MPEKEVEMSPSGELNFKPPQQEWAGNDAVQSAHFAGQQMIKKKSDKVEEYELHYLGLKVSGFEDIEDAKFSAPEFARSVFRILSDFIRDN
jgi:hypothetical protein